MLIVIFESLCTTIFLTPMVTVVCSPSNDVLLSVCRGGVYTSLLVFIMKHSPFEFRMNILMLVF